MSMRDRDFERLYADEAAGLFSFLAYRTGDRVQAEDLLAGAEHRDEVQRALAVLSAQEREAIALRFGAELTVPPMAELLGESLTTMEGRVYRALRKLREA